tara:strand:- start:83 stop:373 length:291 start_codon:yes stop_codon:yes gene_type:complete
MVVAPLIQGSIRIIPVILGESIAQRTTGKTKQERFEETVRETQKIIDFFRRNPYPVDWSIGEPTPRRETTQEMSSTATLGMGQFFLISEDDEEFKI